MPDLKTVPAEPGMVTYMHRNAAKHGIPVSGNFELTSRCNFNCRMCYIHSGGGGKKEDELSAAEWIEAGRQAAESGMVFLLLTGGEPLLREDFAEIYTGLKKLGLIISVNTNGSLLCGETLELFKREPPSRLNVSLYGAGDETYSELCGNRCFNRVTENIGKALEAGIQVKLNYSITPYNCGDMEKIYAFAREKNLNVVTSPYMYPPLRSGSAGFGENSGRFLPEQAAFYRAKGERLYFGEKIFYEKAAAVVKAVCTGAPQGKEPELRSRCRAGRSSCWVDWRGNMSLCGMIPSKNNNITEKGFSQCWEAVRREADSIRLPQKCAGCEYAPVCNVCAAVCKCETGSYNEVPEYMCTLSRTYADIMKRENEKRPGE